MGGYSSSLGLPRLFDFSGIFLKLSALALPDSSQLSIARSMAGLASAQRGYPNNVMISYVEAA